MIKAVLIPAVLAAGIACAPLTQANTQQDQMFIAYLDSRNVHVPDMDSAIQSGHLACRDVAAGKDEVSTEFDVLAMNPSGLSRADASWIIGDMGYR